LRDREAKGRESEIISETTILGRDVSRDWRDGFCLPGPKRFRHPNTPNGYISLVPMIRQLSGPVKVGFEARDGHEWVL
jgi:transposase